MGDSESLDNVGRRAGILCDFASSQHLVDIQAIALGPAGPISDPASVPDCVSDPTWPNTLSLGGAYGPLRPFIFTTRCASNCWILNMKKSKRV